MTNRINNKRNNRIVVAIAATLMACTMSAQTQAHGVPDSVRDRYTCQKRDLLRAHTNTLKAIRAEYHDALAQTAAARRAAVKLCEPSRTYALRQIKAARLEAGECFRDEMLVERKSYRLAVAELDAWYALAKRHSHARVAVTTVPVRPAYVVNRTTTYTVPTHPLPTHSLETVSPGYELIQPQGPVYEGPTFESPRFEGPILEAPIHGSPVIEGPVFPGPVLEVPTPAVPPAGVEFLPTVSANRVRPTAYTTVARTTVARPVQYSTKVVTVTRPVAVDVTPVATYGHDHGRVRSSKAARAAAVGNLVSHALRALGR